jgi:hypothetical protein
MTLKSKSGIERPSKGGESTQGGTKPNSVFVFCFGSNEAGMHGSGAAADARREHGAIYGFGRGRYGNSYAIPTKDTKIHTLPLAAVRDLSWRKVAHS